MFVKLQNQKRREIRDLFRSTRTEESCCCDAKRCSRQPQSKSIDHKPMQPNWNQKCQGNELGCLPRSTRFDCSEANAHHIANREKGRAQHQAPCTDVKSPAPKQAHISDYGDMIASKHHAQFNRFTSLNYSPRMMAPKVGTGLQAQQASTIKDLEASLLEYEIITSKYQRSLQRAEYDIQQMKSDFEQKEESQARQIQRLQLMLQRQSDPEKAAKRQEALILDTKRMEKRLMRMHEKYASKVKLLKQKHRDQLRSLSEVVANEQEAAEKLNASLFLLSHENQSLKKEIEQAQQLLSKSWQSQTDELSLECQILRDALDSERANSWIVKTQCEKWKQYANALSIQLRNEQPNVQQKFRCEDICKQDDSDKAIQLTSHLERAAEQIQQLVREKVKLMGDLQEQTQKASVFERQYTLLKELYEHDLEEKENLMRDIIKSEEQRAAVQNSKAAHPRHSNTKDSAVLHLQVAALEARVQQLNSEVQKLKACQSQGEKRYGTLLESSTKEFDSLMSLNCELTEKILACQQVIQQLRKRLQSTECSVSSFQGKPDQPSELSKLRERVLCLDRMLEISEENLTFEKSRSQHLEAALQKKCIADPTKVGC